MKQPKLYKLYFEYRHEVQPKDAVFACICRAEQVEDIQESYADLWCSVIDRNIDLLDEHSIEKLTSDPILQGWESFEGTILEDLETGERFYWWEEGVDGYKLEPVEEAV